MAKSPKAARPNKTAQAESYQHRDAKSPMRPEVGTQAQFKKKKPPKTYRYDSSLSPAIEWDAGNPAREICSHVSQAFFPRTGAWDNLKKALKGDYDETVWDHLSGTVSAPFGAGEHRQIAVNVIDDRGNELMVVKQLKEDSR